MLYQSNGTKESMINPYDFMVVCDVCLKIINHIHRDNEKEVVKEGKKEENLCLKCKKKGYHWKPWHGSSKP